MTLPPPAEPPQTVTFEESPARSSDVALYPVQHCPLVKQPSIQSTILGYMTSIKKTEQAWPILDENIYQSAIRCIDYCIAWGTYRAPLPFGIASDMDLYHGREGSRYRTDRHQHIQSETNLLTGLVVVATKPDPQWLPGGGWLRKHNHW